MIRRFFRRSGRRVKAAWVGFRDANKPIPFKAPEPILLASVPGDTVFGLWLKDGSRPYLVKGMIRTARIEEDGSLSYTVNNDILPDHWFPAHLCIQEDRYKRWLVDLLEEHGYKPLKMEHIQEAIQKLVVGESFYRDLIGVPDKAEEA